MIIQKTFTRKNFLNFELTSSKLLGVKNKYWHKFSFFSSEVGTKKIPVVPLIIPKSIREALDSPATARVILNSFFLPGY